jgi:pimeloyl-ACP methyl ester carboxylesterase
MRPFPVLMLGLITLLLGAPIPAAARSATPTASPPVAASGDFAGLVDIGGRRLWLECRGTGSPTVVLEAGYPNSAEVWDTVALTLAATPVPDQTAVLPGVAAFTRVCAYDRPGTLLPPDRRGRSDPVPMPRTAADVVADLHTLLETAGVPGPYVLVGHSLGGIMVRLYAATYPEEVAGLVLIEASHEEQTARIQAALGPENWAAFARLQQQAQPNQETDPAREQIDVDASFAQVREAAAQPLPPLPLVVLTRGIPLSAEIPPAARSALPPGFPWETFDTVWQELQGELAALSPRARHLVASESGHYIQLQQPELVITAIRQVVAAVRDPAAWTTPAAIPAAATPA